MPDYQALLTQLEEILHWKKSKKFYADKLGIAESDVDELLKELRTRESIIQEAELGNYVSELEETIVRFEEDILKGTGEIVINTKDEIKSLDELIIKCKIDTDKWEITKYVQNYWGNGGTSPLASQSMVREEVYRTSFSRCVCRLFSFI